MKNLLTPYRKVVAVAACLAATTISCQKSAETDPFANQIGSFQSPEVVPNQYIVTYKDGIATSSRKQNGTFDENLSDVQQFNTNFIEQTLPNDIKVVAHLAGVTNGFTAKLTDGQVELLRTNPKIERVEPDGVVTLSDPELKIMGLTPTGTATTVQSTPWGITKVGGAGNGAGKTVYIVDTGIQFDHPDLNVNTSRSKSFVTGEATADDGHGHGTHVAGIIAAKNDNAGVVGVAAGASVVAIKVLSAKGAGSNTNVINGLNYIASIASPGQVVNMSLGGGASTTLDEAVKKLAAKGIIVVVAAGNENASATTSSPARVDAPNVYTISAMDNQNRIASFSNYGNPPVDYAAPGVSILSTYKGSQYATMSGTSMAAPHAAGILTLGAIRNGGLLAVDKDAVKDVIGIR